MACKCCTPGIWAIITGLLGIIVAFLGIGGSFYVDHKLSQGINEAVVMTSEQSPAFAGWANNTQSDSAPEYLRFYIWNVTNPDDVEEGAIPNVVQMGPYSYRQYNVNFNISFSPDQTEVSWKQWSYYVWDPATSFPGADPHNDVATVVNVPYQAVLGSLQYASQDTDRWWETFFFAGLVAASNSTLFVQKHPNDLIFGYEDPLLELVATFQPGTQTTFALQVNETSLDMAAQVEKMNMADTGKDNITNILGYKMWENQTSMNCWANSWANRIVGNDASQFWPGIKKSDQPWVWSNNLYRSIYLVADQTIEVKGIELINFKLPPSGLDNATNNPQNADFYQFGFNGVENATAPLNGVPMFISKPHFLDADPWFFQHINGLNPNRSLHDLNINVEPNLGTTMSAQKRLQINVKVIPDYVYPEVPQPTYLPVAWIEQLGELTDAQASEFKGKIYFAQKISTIARWTGVATGGFLILVCIILVIRKFKQRSVENLDEREPLIN